MADLANLRIEGTQAIVAIAEKFEGASRRGEQKVTIFDSSKGQELESFGKVRKSKGGAEFVYLLPAALFDAAAHDVEMRSALWEGELHASLVPRDEHGAPIKTVPVDESKRDAKRIAGRVEYFDGEIIKGWAYDTLQANNRAKVEIFIDNVRFAIVTADERRMDLIRRRIGDGRCGFFKTAPSAVLDGKRHVIACIASPTRTLLEDGIIDLDPLELRKFVIKEIVWRINKVESLLE